MTKRLLALCLVLVCALVGTAADLSPVPHAIAGFGGKVAISSDGSIQLQTASGQPIQAYGSSAGFYSGPVVFGSLSSPSVAASGQANLYFDGTALKLSTNGGGYISVGAPDLSVIASHLTFATDNTYDIGANAASRPRDLFVAGSVYVSGQSSNIAGVTLDSSNVGVGYNGTLRARYDGPLQVQGAPIKLQGHNGDPVVLQMKSPDGTLYNVTMANGGTLTVTAAP